MPRSKSRRSPFYPLVSRRLAVACVLGGILSLPAPLNLVWAQERTAAPTSPCEAGDAQGAGIAAIDADGLIRLDDRRLLRLAGIIWPDATQPKAREALRTRVLDALQGSEIRWKAAAPPDRWGHIPASVFLRESSGNALPFLLQAGLIEAGLTPAWPDPYRGACWALLRAHESVAITHRRGVWAPRAQSARHRRLDQARDHHIGQAVVARWRVHSSRSARAFHFANMTPSFRVGPAIMITKAQKIRLIRTGKAPEAWRQKWIIARFVLDARGLSRIRLETSDHVDVLD